MIPVLAVLFFLLTGFGIDLLALLGVTFLLGTTTSFSIPSTSMLMLDKSNASFPPSFPPPKAHASPASPAPVPALGREVDAVAVGSGLPKLKRLFHPLPNAFSLSRSFSLAATVPASGVVRRRGVGVVESGRGDDGEAGEREGRGLDETVGERREAKRGRERGGEVGELGARRVEVGLRLEVDVCERRVLVWFMALLEECWSREARSESGPPEGATPFRLGRIRGDDRTYEVLDCIRESPDRSRLLRGSVRRRRELDEWGR